MKIPVISNASAIIIGAVVIAVAILIVFRWEITGSAPMHRLDRWTGAVVSCLPAPGQNSPVKAIEFNCEP